MAGVSATAPWWLVLPAAGAGDLYQRKIAATPSASASAAAASPSRGVTKAEVLSARSIIRSARKGSGTIRSGGMSGGGPPRGGRPPAPAPAARPPRGAAGGQPSAPPPPPPPGGGGGGGGGGRRGGGGGPPPVRRDGALPLAGAVEQQTMHPSLREGCQRVGKAQSARATGEGCVASPRDERELSLTLGGCEFAGDGLAEG